ncbi:MAG: four helix bundle protein [Minisyncoccia bacterium]
MQTQNKKFRFRQFPVYTDTRVFVHNVKALAMKKFPHTEQFGLFSQLSRALNSIILNIAEGADRMTDKDFAHFLNMSHTSLNEVVACCDIALDSKYFTSEEHKECLSGAEVLANQLTAFRYSLLKIPKK